MNKTVENLLYTPGSRADKWLYAGVLSVIALVFALLEVWMPMLLDDMAFVDLYRFYNKGSDEFSFKALAGYFMDMRQYDNSRIANLLSPFSTIIRPWCYLFPFITGLLTALVVDMIRRLVDNIKVTYWVQGVLIWTMMILFLPWRNCILVYDYMLNYMYSAAVTLLFVWLLCVKLKDSRSGWIVVLTAISAFFAGGWHEGFALPVLVALFVEYIISRCRKPWRWYIPVTVYVLASALFALSPGILSRFSREVTEDLPWSMFKTSVDLSLVAVLLINILIFTIVPELRRLIKEVLRERRHLFLIFSIASVVGGVISLKVHHTPRTSFWPEMCAIVSLMLLFAPLFKRNRVLKFMPAVTAVLFAGCVAFSLHVLEWQYRYKKESDFLMDNLEKSKTGTVFHDIIMPEELPITTLYMNPKSCWVTGFHYYCLDRLFGSWGHIVVPESLRHPYSDARQISDSADIFATGDALWTRYMPDINISGEGFFRIRTKDGKVMDAQGLIHPFVSADGDTLTYIRVHKIPVSVMEDVVITDYSHLFPEKIEYRKIGKPSLANEDEVIYNNMR